MFGSDTHYCDSSEAIGLIWSENECLEINRTYKEHNCLFIAHLDCFYCSACHNNWLKLSWEDYTKHNSNANRLLFSFQVWSFEYMNGTPKIYFRDERRFVELKYFSHIFFKK